MTHRVNWIVAILLAIAAMASPARGGPFDVDGRPPASAVVTLAEVRPTEAGPTSPMLDQLRGVLARLDAKQGQELRATGGGPTVPLPAESTRFCIIHLAGSSGGVKTAEVLRDGKGAYFARDLYAPEKPASKPAATRLNSVKFARLAAFWNCYRGNFTATDKPAAVVELTEGLTPSVFTFDKDLIAERMHSGRTSSLDPTKREIEGQTFMLRLPKGHDPRMASGLLLYVDPGPVTTWPAFTEQVADELGLIVIAPKRIGNRMFAPDRWQLAMDAVQTACARYVVDPRRVYVTGVSGGGQIATHLWLCFPDVFSGAVPIVALATYETVPIGNGTAWAPTFGKPKAEYFKLARQQRCVAMTGSMDFNQRPVHMVQEFLTREGLNIRLDDFADMGHAAPTPERFADALKWVDAPYRTKRDAEITEASLLLAQATELVDETKRREALVAVTRAAPWTPAAWEAVGEIDAGLVPKNSPK